MIFKPDRVGFISVAPAPDFYNTFARYDKSDSQ